MTTRTTRWAALGLMAALGASALSPAAMADSRQKHKNDWRNLGYLGAAVAGYGLLKHNSTATVLGAAGAGYGAYRYEQDRHSQSQAQDARNRYYYRNGNNWGGNNWGNNGRGNRENDSREGEDRGDNRERGHHGHGGHEQDGGD